MKKILIYLAGVFITLTLVKCEKSPYVSKDLIQHMRDSAIAAKTISNICFIYNNNIYFLDNLKNVAQKITNTPTNAKKEVRISHDLQKIAYINSVGNPEIIDRSGSIINTLTSYSNIKQMDWSNDDATLYMLIGSQFFYYGPAISHPLLNFSGIPSGTNPQILSATLSKDNDLAYVVEYFDFTNGYQQKLVLKINDGSNTWKLVDNTSFNFDMKYAKFSAHTKDLVVGYDDAVGSTYAKLTKLELYSNMNNFPDLTIEPCTDCEFKYPIYSSEKKCIVSAFKDGSGSSSSTTFVLSTYYTSDVTFDNRIDYNNTSSDLIVDWK